MSSHNAGKIKWYILTENIFIDGNNHLNIKNKKSIDYFSKNFLQVIDEFSKTKQVINSKNVLIKKYNNQILDTIDWCNEICKLNNIDEDKKYVCYIRGIGQGFEGTLLLYIKIYIYLNLILSDFSIIDIKIYDIIKCFYWSGHFPEFIVDEFVLIIKSLYKIIKKNFIKNNPNKVFFVHPSLLLFKKSYDEIKNLEDIEITQEDLKKIKNFAGLLFRCIYLIYKDYLFNSNIITNSINNLLII